MHFIIISLSILLSLSQPLKANEVPKNPFDLIEAALDAKTITRSQAILYRALAFRGDPHLPAEFQGDASAPQISTSPNDLYVSEVKNVLGEFSAAEEVLALRIIAPPAFVPGMYDISANPDNDELPSPNPDPHWTKLELSSFIIWYADNDPNALPYVTAIKEALPLVLNKLASFMTKTPLSDEAESYEYTTKENKKVVIGNGGNAKLDIYLMPMGRAGNARGYANPYNAVNVGTPTPGFLVMNSSIGLSTARMKSVLMHETMHLVQFAYPKKISHISTYKIAEGVAKWSEDVWDNTSQFEHEWTDFFKTGTKSLKTESYGTWTWYYFLTHELGNFIIDKMYSMMANLEPYKAMNDAIPGGYKDMWPGYTKKEWNQYPPEDDNSFKHWDSFSEVPRDSSNKDIKATEINIDLTKGDYVFSEDVNLKQLTRKYYHFEFAELSMARSFSIGMTHFWAKSKVALRAMVEYESGWKYENWDKQYEDKLFCLDRKAERIKQVILIYSNYDYKEASTPAGFNVKVSATNMACNGFAGYAEGEIIYKSGSNSSKLTMHTDATFTAAPMKVDEAQSGPHFTGIFNLFSIKTTYHYSGSIGACSANQGDTIVLAGEKLKKVGNIGLYPYNDHTTGNYRRVSGAIGHPLEGPINITYSCPDGKTIVVPISLTLMADNRVRKLDTNTTVYSGNSDLGNGAKWKFRFIPVELN